MHYPAADYCAATVMAAGWWGRVLELVTVEMMSSG